MATYHAVIGVLQDTIRTVPGYGVVADRMGARVPWLVAPTPKSAYWTVELLREEQEGVSATGPYARERATYAINGWMPWTYEGDSEATWLSLLQTVASTLRTRRSLGGIVSKVLLPRIASNGIAEVQPPEGPALQCHHAVIEIVAETVTAYTVAE